MVDPVFAAAVKLADALARSQQRIVFAESCTAGLVSATLGRIAGISAWMCGSAVVYRLDTKHRWLDVSEVMLAEHGAVSEAVAAAMASGALSRTPEADVAAAITGHLGPHAPDDQDGLVWMAVAQRRSDVLSTQSRSLPAEANGVFNVRETRQQLAAEALLNFAAVAIHRNHMER